MIVIFTKKDLAAGISDSNPGLFDFIVSHEVIYRADEVYYERPDKMIITLKHRARPTMDEPFSWTELARKFAREPMPEFLSRVKGEFAVDQVFDMHVRAWMAYHRMVSELGEAQAQAMYLNSEVRRDTRAQAEALRRLETGESL
jgi:hypothetical protein